MPRAAGPCEPAARRLRRSACRDVPDGRYSGRGDAASRCRSRGRAAYVGASDRCSARALLRPDTSRSAISRQAPRPALALPAADGALGHHLDLQGEPAAGAQRIDDVGLLRGGLRVAAAARSERDDDRGGGERVQPVHVPDQGAKPASPDALQHGVPRHHRAGRRARPTSCSAACPATVTFAGAAQAARRRRDDLLRRQHAGDRHGHRAVHQPDDLQGLERELPLERAELLRRRRRRRDCRVDDPRAGRRTGSRRWRWRRST